MNYIQYMKDPAGPIKNLSKLNLQPHDYFTLASIVGDLGALGLSLSGFSPAAAVTGAASTTSQLIGDIKRDGFLLKDLGWAALGYGLDAISLIPFGGAAALLAKAAPKLAKAAPIVLGLGTAALSGLGIASSIPAFKKVVNGEKLTMDDYRLMTNALMAVIGLGRLGKAVYDNNKLPTSNDIVTEMSEALQPVSVNLYGKVKYYGPTMGKTTAAKTNPNLVDFDDIVREPIAQLAKLKGVSVRDLKIANDPDYVKLLETEMLRWQSDPANAAKTLVISNKALSNSTGFNNLPIIPDKETFILRLLQRGGGTREEAAAYYDALIAHNPNLKIDNRFVSDIESGTRTANITEAERLGIPKGERNSVLIDRGQLNKRFRWIDGELVPEYKQRTLGDDIPWWDAKNWDIHDGKVYTDADGVKIYKFRPPKVEPLDFTESPIVNWGNELPEVSFTRWDRMLNRPVTRAEFLRPPWQAASEADIKMSKILKSVAENSNISEKLISAFDNAMIEARFRLFYYNKGYYLSEDLTRRDIAKIVADNYAQLTATLLGKLKNLILWNGSSEVKQFDNVTGQFTTIREAAPENFTIIKTGYRTSPSDRAGIYFNTQPVGYDLTRFVTRAGFAGQDLIERFPDLIEYSVTKGDKLPYLINKVRNIIREYWPENLKQLPEGTVFNTTQNKGNLSIYPQDPLKAHEFFVQSPENIKSLFPHPNLFVENADGTWSMIRSWNSPGLHYKSGGTIHIKKKNKGKFTDYCGGKVTEECIRKGKNSSNPTTRKRATFALNSRRWKHEEGGTINYLNYFK